MKMKVYRQTYDFGFAPNPFFGFCSLATCRGDFRRTMNVGDWLMGQGGSELKWDGKVIFLMLIEKKVSFEEYWHNPIYNDKKPNLWGSIKQWYGDNIYEPIVESPDPLNPEDWYQHYSRHRGLETENEHLKHKVKDLKVRFIALNIRKIA